MASMSMPQQSSPVKQEPQVKQEPLSQPNISLSSAYHAQPSIYQQQGSPYTSSAAHPYNQQPYTNFQPQQHPISSTSSSTGSLTSFSTMSSTPNYNLPRHLMAMNMQHGTVGSGPSAANTNGTNSAAGSGPGTPVMNNAHLDPNGLSSAPSSPILNNLQYHPSGANSQFNSNVNSNNNSGGNSPYIQHQSYTQSPYQNQQHPYQHQSNTHPNDPSSNNYYNSSPPYGSHQQQQGQHGSGSGAHVQFSSTAPSPMRQHQQSQYTPLVPPLSESQYAQYHQLLGSSAFSSTQSTPYHSNHSTPYSSMPGSPTREYQQLNEKQLAQKPKRRQVKNACVNCQKACKKCDEGRPCARCIKYGLTETCVDSTRKVRKKGIKRGPYKRRPPPSQLGSASASTTPTMRNAVPPGVAGYMSEPVTALSSPTQSHMLPFTSTAGAPLDFGYDTSGGPGGYSFHSQRMESNYAPPNYTTNYSGSNIYTPPYGMSGSTNSNMS